MNAQVYKFKIEYDEYGKLLNRTVEVSSNYSLANLAYLVIDIFDTLAYHLFMLKYKEIKYELPMEDDFDFTKSFNPNDTKLGELNMEIGDIIEMIYDFGCDQFFSIKLLEITEMEKGKSTLYPRVIDGIGKGILDDVPADEFAEIVGKIKKTGKSDNIYLSPKGVEEPWDYRDFDIDEINRTIKRNIIKISRAYGLE